MNVIITDIEDRDVNAVIAIWRAAGVTRPWNDPAHDIAFARSREHATVLVAHAENSPIGAIMIGEDGHRGWVSYLAVHPEQQKTGLGRKLLEAGEAWLRARGIWKVQLLVRADNAAVIDFYGHVGYRDTQSVCLQKILFTPGEAACRD